MSTVRRTYSPHGFPTASTQNSNPVCYELGGRLFHGIDLVCLELSNSFHIHGEDSTSLLGVRLIAIDDMNGGGLTDDEGECTSGVYLCRLTAEAKDLTTRIVLLK